MQWPLCDRRSQGESGFNWDSCFQSPLLFWSSSMNLLSPEYIYILLVFDLITREKLVSHRWDCTQRPRKCSHLILRLSITFQHQQRQCCVFEGLLIHHPAQRRARAQLPQKNSLFNSLQRQAIGVSAPPYSELLRVEFLNKNQTWERWRATCCRTESSYSCSWIF